MRSSHLLFLVFACVFAPASSQYFDCFRNQTEIVRGKTLVDICLHFAIPTQNQSLTVHSAFSVKADEFSSLETPTTSAVNRSMVNIPTPAQQAVLNDENMRIYAQVGPQTIAAGRQYRKSESGRIFVQPIFSLIVYINQGVLEGMTWDPNEDSTCNACGEEISDQICIDGHCSLCDTLHCASTLQEIEDTASKPSDERLLDCNIKVFVAFSGTDKTGDVFTSTDSLFSKFRIFGVTGLVGEAANLAKNALEATKTTFGSGSDSSPAPAPAPSPAA